jgi:trans-aconitate methyltransferase
MSIRAAIVGQFKKPQGAFGHLAGYVMAMRPSNIRRNLWTVELLALRPEHVILEIGCGPGLALQACLRKLQGGRAVGLDHSKIMVEQSRKRLASDIVAGHAEVRLGSISDVESDGETYDRIFSLNVVQFYPDILSAYRSIYAALKTGGWSATTYQPRSQSSTRADAFRMANDVALVMDGVGFVETDIQELNLKPVPAVCVLGKKPVARMNGC